MSNSVVVVGVDGSPGSLHALRWAAPLARSGHRLVAVNAWEYPFVTLVPASFGGSAAPPVAAMQTAAEIALADGVDEVATEFGVGIEQEVREGSPAAALLAVAEEHDARLVVVGNRGGGGIRQVVLGSVSRRVVTHAERPVVVVPDEAPIDYAGPVVVGIDGSPNSIEALRWALTLSDDPVHAVHVWRIPTALAIGPGDEQFGALEEVHAQALADAVAAAAGDASRRVEEHLLYGDARDLLVSTDLNPSLIVVGAGGHSALPAVLTGSVTTHLISHSPTAVAVVPLVED